MFGYTTPFYDRMSPSDMTLYKRYYCEGCHQLRDGFGLTGTLTVNYDMTFNTILLCGIAGGPFDIGPGERRICVLDHCKAPSDLMEQMAAYTLILTKWELCDDRTDKPSLKTNLISLTLNRAIEKAVRKYPQYDEIVGSGFEALRKLELDGCRDALLMGRTFGRSLSKALEDFAGDSCPDRLGDVFTELTAAVYVMDAVDDLDDDFMDGTYNPILPENGFVNKRDFVNRNLFQVTGLLNEAIGGLQGSYSEIRGHMKGNQSICDNIVYYGVPVSAKKVVSGDAQAKGSVKNVLSKRKDRMSA